jgi:hypothetical protein
MRNAYIDKQLRYQIHFWYGRPTMVKTSCNRSVKTAPHNCSSLVSTRLRVLFRSY